jgi:hypothetical protein
MLTVANNLYRWVDIKSINRHLFQFTVSNSRRISFDDSFVVDVAYLNKLWYYRALFVSLVGQVVL